jgi:OOP family OmpA-OmpF porin
VALAQDVDSLQIAMSSGGRLLDGSGNRRGWVVCAGAGRLVCKAVVALLFVAGGAPALAEGRPYFGVSLGQSKFRSEVGACSDWSGILDPGYSCGGDDKDSAWKAYAGYEFNRYIAVEVGFAELGEQSETASGTVSLLPESVRRGRKVWAVTGALVGSVAITGSLGVTARLGMAYWNEAISVGARDLVGSHTSTGAGPAYGIGLLYGFNRDTGVRVEWERFSDVGDDAHASDVDLVTLGVVHRY